MRLLSRIESSLGLTRGDVTVALFLAGTALFGLLWTTFVGEPEGSRERLELLRMQQLSDSLAAARDSADIAPIDSVLAQQDSASALVPLTKGEIAFDSAADAHDVRRAAGDREAKRPPAGPVNVNTASVDLLVRLPGIGEKTAAAIIAYRATRPFRSPEELMEVKGIGPKKFEKLKPYVVTR